MAMGTSLVALAMLGWGGPNPATEAPSYYRAKLLTIEGTAWRSESFHRMRPVARQGTSTIWTADRALAESLTKAAKVATISPKVEMSSNSSIAHTQNQSYVSHLERVSDGPINQASQVAFVPEVATLPEGFEAKVSGRRLDQGILAHVAIEDAYLVRMAVVALPETIKGGLKPAEAGPIGVAHKVLRTVFEGPSEGSGTTIRGQIQIPEVAKGRAEGEWLVPHDGVLLISLGIHTSADPKGMAVTEERLAIVEFDSEPIRPIATEAFAPSAVDACPAEFATLSASPFVAGEPMPIALGNLPLATPPSRSLPRSIDLDGKEIDLPPLPEAVASADLNMIEPGSKLASPQMWIPGPTADPALARTSFADPAPATPACGLAKLPLPEFARRLIERMGEYEMDIDLSDDGRTCHIALHDAKGDRAETDPSCPPEPRCDNAKEMDAAAICSALLEQLDLSAMKPGQELDFEVVSGDGPAAPLVKLLLSSAKQALSGPPIKPEGCSAKDTEVCCEATADPKTKISITGTLEGKSSTFKLSSALKNPGTTETTLIPLTEKFSLEIKATVVPTPAPVTASTEDKAAERVAYAPKRVDGLMNDLDAMGRAANAWNRFWFADRPSQMAPFRVGAPVQP